MDPLRLTVFKNKLVSIAEEMGTVLQKTAFSSNIKERKDLSCALFNPEGELVAQAEHIPVHLGSMSTAVKSVLDCVDLKEGDVVILNDPFRGGTHLPDITLVAPFFGQGEMLFLIACRAHHADVGGVSAGSMPLSRDIFQEGIVIPPVKIAERGSLKEEVLELIVSNVRTPKERRGDLKAQLIAIETGKIRLKELLDNLGKDEVLRGCSDLLGYTERFMRSRIREIPDGVYTFEDSLEDDGAGKENIGIRVRVEIKGDEAAVDFSETDPQTQGCLNCVRSVTLAAVYYCFRSLLPEEVPTNDGCFRPISVITKEGTVVDAFFPSAVAGGNVETSQRIVDVVLGALSKALPDMIPSASQGTMNNVAMGGTYGEGNDWSYYETIGGGMGAWPGGNGESAVHCHMTNTMNTPVEALEHSFPLMVTAYSVRRGSGGKGKWRGGDGIVREIKFMKDSHVTVISERRRIAPYGLSGGQPGMMGKNIHITGEKSTLLPSKFSMTFREGEKLRIETPGGGGYG